MLLTHPGPSLGMGLRSKGWPRGTSSKSAGCCASQDGCPCAQLLQLNSSAPPWAQPPGALPVLIWMANTVSQKAFRRSLGCTKMEIITTRLKKKKKQASCLYDRAIGYRRITVVCENHMKEPLFLRESTPPSDSELTHFFNFYWEIFFIMQKTHNIDHQFRKSSSTWAR